MRTLSYLSLLIATLLIVAPAPDALAQEQPPLSRECFLALLLGGECETEEEDEEEVPPPPNSAAEALVSASTPIDTASGAMLTRSSSTLTRTERSVTATVDLADQVPNQATTLWWVVYNQPENCAEAFCALSDLFNPETEGSFFGAGGSRVSDRFGQVRLEASVYAGAGLPVGPEGSEPLDDFGFGPDGHFGPGITNPMGAQIQLITRTHGDADELAEQSELENALTSLFGGGCPFDLASDPETECTEPVFVVHFP